MKLLANQDERDLASMLRALLAAECPTTVARALHNGTAERMPPTLSKALADAGVFGLGIPTEYGGSGGSLTDLGVFFREAGRALCPIVVHSTAIAAHAVYILGGRDGRRKWLPGLASGTVVATTALWNPNDASDITSTLHARRDSDGSWHLDGTADFVTDADLADLIVVSAQDGSAFIVDLQAAGISVEPLQLMGGHAASHIRFDGVVVDDDALLATAVPDDRLHRIANAAVALTSLDLVGIAESVLERTVDYISMREQFGRPIASFQAAQHLVADMHIALAAARLAALSAVYRIASGRSATRETAISRMQSATAVKHVTLDAHQLQGGMGYVVETDLHLWSERARVLSTLGGGADVAATWLERDEEGR
jgi:alkylation response protein AidB-like acyl-CoA dehydrogenase